MYGLIFSGKNYTEKTYAHRHEEIRVAYVGITRSKKRLFMWRPMPNAKKGEHSFDPLQISYYDYNKPTPQVPTQSFDEDAFHRRWRPDWPEIENPINNDRRLL